MKIYDFIEIDDNHIPDLFQKGIKDLDIDDMDLAILKAFYALKFKNSDTGQISYFDMAQYLASTVPDSDNSMFWYFYEQINQRAPYLTDLPFFWDLNKEIDAIILKSNNIETINYLKQYRKNGGIGILKSNFIYASIYKSLNSDGSIYQFFVSPPNPLDDLFYKALNIE